MLFCLSSPLPRALESALFLLQAENVPEIGYSSAVLDEIMKKQLWAENAAIVLPSPAHWREFAKRPFCVLVSLLSHYTSEDFPVLISDGYREYQKNMHEMKKKTYFDRITYVEVFDADVASVLEHKIRPEWSRYFMSLAMAASTRANCMKKRVGALIVKSNRVLSVGYNGTSLGMSNCSDGGCLRCNKNIKQGMYLSDCFCIHAEESTFLDSSSKACEGAELYTTVFPCTLCARKIIQLKMVKVYYVYDYGEIEEIKKLFTKNGILWEHVDGV